jgi:hypothetical protein
MLGCKSPSDQGYDFWDEPFADDAGEMVDYIEEGPWQGFQVITNINTMVTQPIMSAKELLELGVNIADAKVNYFGVNILGVKNSDVALTYEDYMYIKSVLWSVRPCAFLTHWHSSILPEGMATLGGQAARLAVDGMLGFHNPNPIDGSDFISKESIERIIDSFSEQTFVSPPMDQRSTIVFALFRAVAETNGASDGLLQRIEE